MAKQRDWCSVFSAHRPSMECAPLSSAKLLIGVYLLLFVLPPNKQSEYFYRPKAVWNCSTVFPMFIGNEDVKINVERGWSFKLKFYFILFYGGPTYREIVANRIFYTSTSCCCLSTQLPLPPSNCYSITTVSKTSYCCPSAQLPSPHLLPTLPSTKHTHTPTKIKVESLSLHIFPMWSSNISILQLTVISCETVDDIHVVPQCLLVFFSDDGWLNLDPVGTDPWRVPFSEEQVVGRHFTRHGHSLLLCRTDY